EVRRKISLDTNTRCQSADDRSLKPVMGAEIAGQGEPVELEIAVRKFSRIEVPSKEFPLGELRGCCLRERDRGNKDSHEEGPDMRTKHESLLNPGHRAGPRQAACRLDRTPSSTGNVLQSCPLSRVLNRQELCGRDAV